MPFEFWLITFTPILSFNSKAYSKEPSIDPPSTIIHSMKFGKFIIELNEYSNAFLSLYTGVMIEIKKFFFFHIFKIL